MSRSTEKRVAVQLAADPLCVCGHRRSRHFAGSMVRGYHACLVVDGKPIKHCECRRFREASS